MKHCLIRDDDVNALSSPDRLDRLFRPFLEQGIPVNLAVIPEVRTDTRLPDGTLEGFLEGPEAGQPGILPIGSNTGLVDHLVREPDFHVAQHGLTHEMREGGFEFGGSDPVDIASRLDRGLARFEEAGLPGPRTFVAPQDHMSRVSLSEAARRFDVVSGGWYDLSMVPGRWWPIYLLQKKVLGRSHWQAAETTFLSHPGCLLAPDRNPEGWSQEVRRQIDSRQFTVVVVHHWEFFDQDGERTHLVEGLHAFASELASWTEVGTVTFTDVAEGRVPL